MGKSAMVAIADLAAVGLFVGIGRSAHGHNLSVSGFASTAWPFLSGLAAGWLAVIARRRDAASLRGGSAVWLSTVVLGMVLRVIGGQGTAVAFVFVALGFLGATMLGGRAVVAALGGRRRPTTTRADGLARR
jgi:hypothetical protein